jgi:hypothetical protein
VSSATAAPAHRVRDVFSVLYGDAEGLVELRALPSRDRTFCAPRDVDAIEAFARPRMARENLYFGVATRRDATSGTLENCQELSCLFVDLDYKDVPEAEAMRRIHDAPLCPTVVNESGGGLHVAWALKEPIAPDDAKPLLRRLALYFGADLASAEAARVLRLPNTTNHKYSPPRRVTTTLLEPDCRYNVSDFEEWLPAEPAAHAAHTSEPFAVPPLINNGQRNEILYKTCRSLLARQLAPSVILAAARETNAAQCRPPLSDTEVADIVQHAIRQPDRAGFERRAIQADAPDGDPSASPFPDGWRLLDDVQLMALPDPEWLVADVAPRRGVGVIYGPSGGAKTTLVAGLALSVATKRSFYGHEVRHRGSFVYVASEDPSGFKVRLRAAKIAAHIPLTTPIGVYTFPEPIDLRNPVSVAAFTRFLRQTEFPQPLEGILLDTYAAAMPGASENSSEDTTLAMAHAHQWREQLGVTVILVHHSNAGGTRERGHSAMRGAADFMISMTPVDDAIHVECNKQRNGSPFQPITLKLVPVAEGGCVLRPASDVLPSTAFSAAQQKVYAVLQETFATDGATKSEWQRACLDIAERSFHRASKVLVERGFVNQVGSHFRISGKAAA